ncbi:hypothetical protein DQ239_02045 [Blastococcus sp. TF02-09]|uniref:hypothetical protein n=1 Tax=Blastococcus sp. TF02-09 TaxID=2250576 RepID=UPI000DEB665D|nr:hypothetical protein [Blastococcus sp. TF02-9]RBY81394.1 hypothetical protein DQ239_02045 [Blastococcus sp. TF02-9]
MADSRPDTDEHADPGGTPTQGQDDLIRKPVTPGADDGSATAVPGVYEADEDDQQRGKEVKPGN